MRRLVCVILAAGVLAIVCENCFASEEMKIGFSADYFSKYIWRGQNLNDESVFQPSVSLSKYGFTGSIWGSQDWKNENGNAGEFTEFDYALDYSAAIPDIEAVNFSAGVVYYEFPHTTFKPTTEVYGGLSLNTFLAPFVKLYRDIDEIDGSYLQAGIGHTIEKIAQFSDSCYCGFQLGTSIGYGSSQYNGGYFGENSGKLNDWTISSALPVCLGDWTIKPSINYSMMLSDTIRSATEKSDNLWAGVGISRSF